MSQVIIFGLRDIASLAHFYLKYDSDDDVVAFSVHKQFLPKERKFEGLPVVPFEEVERLYPAMTGDASTLLDDARDLSSVLGRDVVIRAADGSTIEGTADGFETDGALRLLVDGEPTSVHVGEIEQLRTS